MEKNEYSIIYVLYVILYILYISGKESACNARDTGSIPGLGTPPGGGHSNPLQYSCLENPMDRKASWATVHGITKCWIQLKQLSMHA